MIQFKKLNDGSWGIRGVGLTPGAVVTVTRRDGTTRVVVCGDIVMAADERGETIARQLSAGKAKAARGRRDRLVSPPPAPQAAEPWRVVADAFAWRGTAAPTAALPARWCYQDRPAEEKPAGHTINAEGVCVFCLARFVPAAPAAAPAPAPRAEDSPPTIAPTPTTPIRPRRPLRSRPTAGAKGGAR